MAINNERCGKRHIIQLKAMVKELAVSFIFGIYNINALYMIMLSSVNSNKAVCIQNHGKNGIMAYINRKQYLTNLNLFHVFHKI